MQGQVSKKSTHGNQKDKPASSSKVYALIEGQTTIISIVPDGSNVKKGDRRLRARLGFA